MSQINRREFITLSTAAAAALLLVSAGETWTHDGVVVTVSRTPDMVAMSFDAGKGRMGFGYLRNAPNQERMDEALRHSARSQIDQHSGYTSRWLAARETRPAEWVNMRMPGA